MEYDHLQNETRRTKEIFSESKYLFKNYACIYIKTYKLYNLFCWMPVNYKLYTKYSLKYFERNFINARTTLISKYLCTIWFSTSKISVFKIIFRILRKWTIDFFPGITKDMESFSFSFLYRVRTSDEFAPCDASWWWSSSS